jgi:segregation and condensation protein B
LKESGLKNIIESLIFASDEEVSLKQLKEILDGFKIESTIKEIESIIENLNAGYEETDSAFEIIKVSGGYQFATKKKYAQFIGKLYGDSQKKKLSQSAIETLSIIAYKQPITRSEMEFIRGVNVDYIVNSLLERDLITIKGRADGPGRPILYGTTNNFLKVLGLNTLDDLPKLKEINEILKAEKIEGISEADIDLFNSVNNVGNNIEVPKEENKSEMNEENLSLEFPNDETKISEDEDEKLLQEFPNDETKISEDEDEKLLQEDDDLISSETNNDEQNFDVQDKSENKDNQLQDSIDKDNS